MKNNEVGKILRERRISLKLTMKEVAQMCYVSESTVSRWETGEIDNIKRGSIYLLSQALHLPIETILGIKTRERIIDSEVILKRQEINKLIEKIDDLKELNKISKFINDFIINDT